MNTYYSNGYPVYGGYPVWTWTTERPLSGYSIKELAEALAAKLQDDSDERKSLSALLKAVRAKLEED